MFLIFYISLLLPEEDVCLNKTLVVLVGSARTYPRGGAVNGRTKENNGNKLFGTRRPTLSVIRRKIERFP